MQLRFLDEYVFQDSVVFEESVIGGLSGVDKNKSTYYFVVDDSKKPRVLKGEIVIENGKIIDVSFKKTILINDTINGFYQKEILDLESVFVDSKGNLNVTSEGSIKNNKRPTVFVTDSLGSFVEEVLLPDYLGDIDVGKHRHNGVFEGSSKSIDGRGFWVSLEAPLRIDGEEPSYSKKKSPIRITYFDSKEKKATKQYAYELEYLEKPAKGDINLNGVTAILEFGRGKFFVVERIYQSGYGSYGNTIRIFKASADNETTNTLGVKSLKNSNYIPLKKELLFDFEWVKAELMEGVIDNIEGICFGDVLPNGNKTLLLISDDNFQLYGKQLNQFILMEIVE
ncbi:esterase-like activity of phytase family protein [Tenacibaculum sp. MAR_2009_124]|uniref:esterase-like activity of phytase family protein n=1 Tax=Tenacibaculum sp. MAR_2009_124 TaxID=1250059 RepID=UPI000B2CEB14|nr:esterase-like activity of phytase family protein [Tenacibaculum sp. MAR_2009_124]